jgi:hypothetical protein
LNRLEELSNLAPLTSPLFSMNGAMEGIKV